MDASPLNGIPAEIRIKIYEAVLLVPDGIRLEYNGRTNQMETEFSDPAQKHDSFALIATSRQVRHETLPVLFGSNTIRLVCITFNNPHGISDVTTAQKTTSALSRCPFTPYMRRVRIQLGCWVIQVRGRENQAVSAAADTLKIFAQAFPILKVRLECHFSVQEGIFGSLRTKQERIMYRPLQLHILRGESNSLAGSIQRAVTERCEVLRELAPNREQSLIRTGERITAKLARLARIMAAEPMWTPKSSVGGSAQTSTSEWADGEDERKDRLEPKVQG